MEFGVAIFFTDYSIKPTALACALEERGFESLWCPEHSHIPVSRLSKWPQQGEAGVREWGHASAHLASDSRLLLGRP